MELTLGDRITLALCEIQVNQLLENWNYCHDEKGMFCEGSGSGSGAGGSYTPMRGIAGSTGTFPAHSRGLQGTPIHEMDSSMYLSQQSIHEPWIGEIAPSQYAGMSQRQKDAYDKKRSDQWNTASQGRQEWASKLMEAYDTKQISLSTPGIHPAAVSAIKQELIARDERATKAAIDSALEDNRIKSISDLNKGDKVYSILYRRAGMVEKVNPKSARIDFGIDAQGKPFKTSMDPTFLHKENPNEVETRVKEKVSRKKLW